MTRIKSLPSILLLILIVFVGGLLRFYRLDWDANQHVHPDERYIAWVATYVRWPVDPGAVLDPQRSTLNPFYWPPQADAYNVQVPHNQPRTFAYGHFPLYLLVMVVNGLAVLTGQADWLSFDKLTLVGRALSGAFDLGTVIVTFSLGRRLLGRAVGLLAAALVAGTPLHIQLSHFYAVDTLMAFFVMAALWLTVCYLQEKRLRDGLAAGACAGLAIGCKFTAAWSLAVLVAMMIVNIRLEMQPTCPPARFSGLELSARRVDRRALAAILLRLKPVGELLAAAFIAFAVTNPFALIEARTFLTELASQGAMARGNLDWEYTRQYHNTWPYLYPISQMLRFGLGPALTLTGLAGVGWSLWRAWRQTFRLDELTLLAWTASYFALTGGLYVKFIRYMLPIVPALSIYAAAILIAITRKRWVWGGALVAITMAMTTLYGWAFARVYDGEHPWLVASRWIYAHVPARSFLLVEHWDDRLPLDLETEGQSQDGSAYYYTEVQPYDEPDSPEKLAAMLLALSGSDYVILATHRLWGTIPRWPERYPLATRYYRALFDGRLGFQLDFFAARYPRLGPITLMDQPLTDPAMPVPLPWRDYQPSPFVIGLGRADESWTVYDHPLVLIFRNIERLSPEQMRERAMRD